MPNNTDPKVVVRVSIQGDVKEVFIGEVTIGMRSDISNVKMTEGYEKTVRTACVAAIDKIDRAFTQAANDL
ncbi:hypothetical protein [Sodalis sp. dw_96]|uniref:hypothetical protein n=1 Tax=Sodalis sp. dw_96 TaxID=2719794 RepID=UPI001BD2E30B|nr:hypothetical protein [Sodalis sp. dw_96]